MRIFPFVVRGSHGGVVGGLLVVMREWVPGLASKLR